MSNLFPKKAIFRLVKGISLSERQLHKLELRSLLIQILLIVSHSWGVRPKRSHKIWANGGHGGEEKY